MIIEFEAIILTIYCIERGKVIVSKESSTCSRVGGEVKHQNLVSNKLIWVKYPPWQGSKADVSSVSPSLFLLLNRERASMLDDTPFTTSLRFSFVA